MTTREERAARYRAFMCVGCGEKRYSAGRPFCDECFRKRGTPFEPGLMRRGKGA